MTPLTQALTYTGDVQVCAPTQIGSVPRGVPRWTTEQEEHLKVYSRKRAPAQIGSVPRWTQKQQEQLKVYSRKRGDGVAHQGEQLDQPLTEQQGSTDVPLTEIRLKSQLKGKLL